MLFAFIVLNIAALVASTGTKVQKTRSGESVGQKVEVMCCDGFEAPELEPTAP